MMLAGKVLITGGGGAIAGEMAQRLEARGHTLVLADIDRGRMEANAKALKTPPIMIDADLSTAEGIAALAAAIERDHADLEILVNNAGYIEPGDAHELAPAVLDRHLMINLAAPMQLARAAARVMLPRRRGHILSIVSMGGIVALRGSAAYAAAKFGLRGFQTSIRAELKPHGIGVSGVFPSGVDTPMLRYEATHNGSPLNFVGRVLTPGEVAQAAMRALDSGRLETYVPYGDSLTTRLVGAFPWLIERLLPLFEAKGEAGRRRFLAQRGLDG